MNPALPDEPSLVRHLMQEAAWFEARMPEIRHMARQWVHAVRQEKNPPAVAAFLAEYTLSSEEGLLLMSLAEALLRIPDAATADALIHDKLAPGRWEEHTGLGRPWFVRAAGHGLNLADAIADEARLGQSVGAFLAGLVHRLGEPVVRAALRQAMRLMGEAFVFAPDMAAALRQAATQRQEGEAFSFDMLGEGARSQAQAEAYFQRYRAAITALAAQPAVAGGKLRDGISIKLSALHPRLELRHWKRLEAELLPRLESLVRQAAQYHIPLTIDAEEAVRREVTLRLFEALRRLPALAGYDGLGLAVQAYHRQAIATLERLDMLAERTGVRLPVRLVKGAYWDGEIKRAQMDGLSAYPVFTCKAHTDLSYLACAEFMLARRAHFYPQFATHNALTIAALLTRMSGTDMEAIEFQRLHGMGEALYTQVRAGHAVPCRIYAPVGPPRELLSYLIRRILENGANSSFVRALADNTVEEDTLLASPFAQAESTDALPPPPALFTDRLNSLGVDLSQASVLAHWQEVIAVPPSWPELALSVPVAQAYAEAVAACAAWAGTPVQARATQLERLADLLEENREPLVRLLVHEARKTLADALAEVREAVDFCRYYAHQARVVLAPQVLPGPTGERNMLILHPRGVMVAISPWNFPLAIFIGQVTAALAAGNCVLAKPAGQTSRIAAAAVTLMHRAGIPPAAVQLVPGAGAQVGEALVAHPDCAGVVFTGSTATARHIQRALAAKEGPILPLIAETGGQNCMVVDASALPEQAVDDMVASAFFSAGQRCSALRVAFVQEDIAPSLLAMLAGAMEALQVGDPAQVETDIGPLIDAAAAARVMLHVQAMQAQARQIAATPLPAGLDAAYVAPHAFEIPHIGVLAGEVFGPVLHVIRYRAGELDTVIAHINATGYGLTFGVHSRIDSTIARLCCEVKAGNIYVNRTMTGAVVGVQPFGGQGLSGTGPKAGGPHYLPRFCHERVVSTNTAAIGGNTELLARRE